ncbi:hypothetical protein DP73_00175 [Desulfosporosinus sp. HMP52]|nr:hypothetical protein DP73_00175 [Desulfosporosinus sp. HMP52]
MKKTSQKFWTKSGCEVFSIAHVNHVRIKGAAVHDCPGLDGGIIADPLEGNRVSRKVLAYNNYFWDEVKGLYKLIL